MIGQMRKVALLGTYFVKSAFHNMTGYIPLGVLYIYPDVTCIEIKAISPIK